MSTIKLTYFDIDGGRGEPVRIALTAAGIAFEDERLNFQEFGERRAALPLNTLPVVEIDGTAYTQTNAMIRYFGKRAGLYPEDDWEAFLADEILDVMEDSSHAVVRTFGLEGDALKTAREELVAGPLPRILKLLNKRLEAAGGDYFADKRLTLADIKVAGFTRWLKSGMLDHVPTDLVDRLAPLLIGHMETVYAEPVVSAYYQKRRA